MAEPTKHSYLIPLERKIGSRVKNGFYLEALDGEPVGRITDVDILKEIPKKKITFKRMIDKLEKNGFYLKYVEQKSAGFLKTIFPSEQTGELIDKYWLDDTPFEVGDVLRITIVPNGNNKIRLLVEYRWEDQVDDK